jgi:outer membrane receptor protein involved in Fe transport
VGANSSYQAESYQGLGDPSVLKIPEYALLDLRAGLEHDNWKFQVWGRNITDKFYVSYTNKANDEIVRYPGMPVTYGVTLSYRYH